MNFQPPTTTASTGFSFGLPATSTPTKPTSFTFGSTGGGDAPAPVKPLNFGTIPAAPATTATVVAPSAPGSGFFSAPSTTSAPALATTTASIATTATAPAPTQAFSFGAAPAATAVTTTPTVLPTLTLPKTTAPALGMPVAAPATTATGFTTLSTATKTTNSSAVANVSQMSYNQIEEHINKWTLELEEQEKVFTDQATQINAWDKILINNNTKILELNEAVQKVKTDQQTVEQELEFIATHHKELEESLAPLQTEFLKIPQVDVERTQTYLLVENLDTQLKQMSEDLKEIIDNLNESNKGQDNSDPFMQIGKILNAHMSSLQWTESQMSNISNKLDEITKMHETLKRDSERSLRSAYFN